MVMHDSTDFSYLPIDDKVESMKREVLPKCCYQMHQKIYQIALEDNLIEFSPKNSEIHKLRININTFVQIALQCNTASYVMSCMYQ